MANWNPKGGVSVVTGASSGIGRCLTIRLIEKGCRVIAVARRKDRLDALKDQIDSDQCRNLVEVVGDITEPETRARIAQAVDQTGGSLDLLVNNAGIGAIGPFEDASEQRLRHVMEVNFFAPVELTRLLLPHLKRSEDAVLCNIGSVLGHRAVPDKSEYCASKFAMHGWSDSIRAELAPAKIAVTLVSPSTTQSEFFDALVDTDPDVKSKSIGSWPADRVARATMIAIRKRRAEAILSMPGKALVYADRLSPPLMNRMLQRQ